MSRAVPGKVVGPQDPVEIGLEDARSCNRPRAVRGSIFAEPAPPLAFLNSESAPLDVGNALEEGPLRTERVIRTRERGFDAEPRLYTPSRPAYPARKDLVRREVRGVFLERILQPGRRCPDEE